MTPTVLIQPLTNQDNYDGLDDWKRLRAEGKVKIGKDLERDSKTSRLGSEVSGLITTVPSHLIYYIPSHLLYTESPIMY